jgi:hypothetical protein
MLTAQLISAADASVNKTSSPYDKGDLTSFSVQFTFSSATLNGTASLECSNNNNDWIQVTGSSVAVASGAVTMINVINGAYRWVRAVWTASSGTGTVTADAAVVQPANRF